MCLKRANSAMFRARARWYEHGERNSRYFFSLEKCMYNAKTCHKLITENAALTSDSDILEYQRAYFEQLYRVNPEVRFNLENTTHRKISLTSKEELNRAFTIGELDVAVSKLKNNKTPGYDGLPAEFYKAFWPYLREHIFELVEYVYNTRQLHPSGLIGFLNVIPKPGKDSTLITNLRPITLLNTDYKLIEKVICNRIMPVMHNLIHNDQTGFMSNRRISVNIRKLLDIMHITERDEIEAFVLSLDCSKAFDKLSFCAIKGSLVYFNFPDYIIDWVEIMYTNFVIKVQNNGKFSSEFQVQHGIHQGGVCSATLFVLAVETLANLIRDNPDIHGIPISNNINRAEHGSSVAELNQFADDMDVFSLFQQSSLDAILGSLKKYYYNSGMEINYNKTTLYRIGSLKYSMAQLYTQQDIKWTSENIVVLGVVIAQTDERLLELNYIPVFEKVKTILDTWANRGLSLIGRVSIVNTLVASQFIYKFTVLPNIPSRIQKSIDVLISRFLWSEKKAKISLNNLQLLKKCGGLALCNLKWREIAIKTTWIQILHRDSKCASIAYEAIGCCLGKDMWSCNVHRKDISIATQGMSQFWKDIFTAWFTISYDRDTHGSHQLIWFNSYIRINGVPFLWPNVYLKGLRMVSQLFPDGVMISTQVAYDSFGLNYLQLYQLITAIPVQWKMDVSTTGETIIDPPFVQFCVKYANLSRYVYKELATNSNRINSLWCKWAKDLTCTVEEFESAFRNIYLTTNVPKLRSFLYRLLNRAIITNIHLKRWGRKNDGLCGFCGENEEETYTHLFYFCHKAQMLWQNVQEYAQKCGVTEPLDMCVESVILDSLCKNSKSVSNYLCVVTKQYIYAQRCMGLELSSTALINRFNYFKNIEKYIATKNSNLGKFYSKWEQEAEIDDWCEVSLDEYVNQYLSDSY